MSSVDKLAIAIRGCELDCFRFRGRFVNSKFGDKALSADILVDHN